MRPKLALAAATFVMLCASLAACSEDKPAVCDSVDSLKSSVDDLKDIDVTESGALSELQNGLADIDGELAQVKSDAESKFSSQIDAISTAYDALKTAVQAAVADPSAASLAAAGSAWTGFSTDVKALIDDVQSTC
jgi:ABC-type oligopeptide transport system substrate-binding subunit